MGGRSRLGGRYRLVERLGCGGMSVVWRGFDEVLQREVAVKLLAPDIRPDAQLRQRIRREAQAAARLCHPHIATVYDYGEALDDAGRPSPFVVLELISGVSLSDRLAGGGRLPWREAVTICAQVASALCEAHEHGVVHRDVKPGNVVLTAAGAKVVDFGISAVVGESELGMNGQLLGTPAYLAPERLDGGRADTAADVYALGLLLYRSLTGTLPWPAGTPTETLLAHREVEPAQLPALPGLPADVARVCHQCLAREPERRPASHEVARALARAAGIPVPLRQYPSPAGSPAAAAAATATTLWDAGAIVPAVVPVRGRPARQPASRPGTVPSLSRPVRSAGRRRALPGLLATLAIVVAAVATMLHRPGPGSRGSDTEALDVPPVGLRAPVRACRVRYQVERDWSTGFTAVVTVTNAGSSTLQDADVRFAFPGNQAIMPNTSIWAQSGRSVTGRLDGAASNLRPGGSAQLWLTARYRSDNPLPTAFFIDGTACTALVSASTTSQPTRVGPGGAEPAPAPAGPSQAPEPDRMSTIGRDGGGPGPHRRSADGARERDKPGTGSRGGARDRHRGKPAGAGARDPGDRTNGATGADADGGAAAGADADGGAGGSAAGADADGGAGGSAADGGTGHGPAGDAAERGGKRAGKSDHGARGSRRGR